MALKEVDVGRSLAIGSEMDEEASTEVVELSEATSLKEVNHEDSLG